MAIRFLFSLALLLPALTSAQSTQLRVPATIDTLPNGLTLIVHEDHSVPRVVTNVWFRVGSGDEKPGRTYSPAGPESASHGSVAHGPDEAFREGARL